MLITATNNDYNGVLGYTSSWSIAPQGSGAARSEASSVTMGGYLSPCVTRRNKMGYVGG